MSIATIARTNELLCIFSGIHFPCSTTKIICIVFLHYQEKCYQYWPEKGCWMYGNIRVALEDVIVLVDYTIRKFCVQYVSKICESTHTTNVLTTYTLVLQELLGHVNHGMKRRVHRGLETICFKVSTALESFTHYAP